MKYSLLYISRQLGATLIFFIALFGLFTINLAQAQTLIATCVELQAINNDVTANYELTSDIDCATDTTSGGALFNAGAGFSPLGTSTAPYVGTFDGAGYTIENLFINRPAGDEIGLFGRVGNGGVVENVQLTEVDITGRDDVGALAGRLASGAIVGTSSATGAVIGRNDVGGLVGYHNATLRRSFANVQVSGNDNVGGLIGRAFFSSLRDAYARGAVTGSSTVGALIGAQDTTTHQRTFSTGLVTATSTIFGGITASTNNTTPSGTYWDVESTGVSVGEDSANFDLGTSTTQMKTISIYASAEDVFGFSLANYDIATTTLERNDGYPFLAWEVGSSSSVWLIYEASQTPTENKRASTRSSQTGTSLRTRLEFFLRHGMQQKLNQTCDRWGHLEACIVYGSSKLVE